MPVKSFIFRISQMNLPFYMYHILYMKYCYISYTENAWISEMKLLQENLHIDELPRKYDSPYVRIQKIIQSKWFCDSVLMSWFIHICLLQCWNTTCIFLKPQNFIGWSHIRVSHLVPTFHTLEWPAFTCILQYEYWI